MHGTSLYADWHGPITISPVREDMDRTPGGSSASGSFQYEGATWYFNTTYLDRGSDGGSGISPNYSYAGGDQWLEILQQANAHVIAILPE